MRSSKLWSLQLWTQCSLLDFTSAVQYYLITFDLIDFYLIFTSAVQYIWNIYMKYFIYMTPPEMASCELIDHICSSIYMKYFICYFTFIRTHNWPATNVSGFIAQLVRASHRYREITGSKSWIFEASIGNCINRVHNCKDHTLLDSLLCSRLSRCHATLPLKRTFRGSVAWHPECRLRRRLSQTQS